MRISIRDYLYTFLKEWQNEALSMIFKRLDLDRFPKIFDYLISSFYELLDL